MYTCTCIVRVGVGVGEWWWYMYKGMYLHVHVRVCVFLSAGSSIPHKVLEEVLPYVPEVVDNQVRLYW